jgi:hypothetical protein
MSEAFQAIGSCIGACDPELRELCDIEGHEKPYHPSQLTRFRQRVGPERLERIMETIVGRLRDAGVVKGDIVACDATFIKHTASVTQKMTLEAIAIQTLGLEGLRRAIGSATT